MLYFGCGHVKYLNTINVPSSNTTAQTAIEPTEESDDNGTTNDLTEDSEDDAAESNQSDIDDDPNWTPERIDELYQKLGEDTANDSKAAKPRYNNKYDTFVTTPHSF